MLIGPVLGTAQFFRSDSHARNTREVRQGWGWHLPAVLAVLCMVYVSPMPLWAYLIACYAALSLLRDVAEIAVAFGWSEERILALTPHRRAAYLDMLRQA